MYNSLEKWLFYCIDHLSVQDDQYTQSIRKIVPDDLFDMGMLDDSIKLTNVGFKEGGSKLTMLKKYYFNQQSIDKAKLALEKLQKSKKFGSVAFSTIGEEKKFTHHQHCIQSISIRHHKDGELEYTVFYRAAEVIKIFTGDMVFMRDVIMPIFGPGKVKFFFSNATLNAMYVPLLFQWLNIDQIEDWGYDLRRKDKAFYNRCVKWTDMYFSKLPINYSSAEVIRAHIHSRIKAGKRDCIKDVLY